MSMQLPYNMDRSQTITVDTASMPWQPSPSPHVQRKPLEREHAEHGQVTSVVLYEPEATFSEHRHPLGEEIFVLSGEFADENGRYPAGTYLRNPPDSFHSPYSQPGCEIFVKLDQFKAHDATTVVTRTDSATWQPGPDAFESLSLHSFENEHTLLVRWPQQSQYEKPLPWKFEEAFVISGTFVDEHGQYPPHTWMRGPELSQRRLYTKEGGVMLVKIGHLS